jgi:hypothetical protein
VVHIDFDIALAGQIQMETAMDLEQVKHVIQESGTRTDFTSRGIVEVQVKLDIGFTRLARNLRRTHHQSPY